MGDEVKTMLAVTCAVLMWPALAAADCRQFEDIIKRSSKALSGSYAESAGTPASGLQSVLAIQTIQVNLMLMAANGCKLPNHPISVQNYLDAAYQCETDRIKDKNNTSPKSCNADTWEADK